jgi:SAM-dependent methyltransferase
VSTAIELDYDKLMLIMQGHSAFQLLWSGEQLGLYSDLSNDPGLTSEQIGERIGLKPYPCSVLLVGLTAIGVLKKLGDRYYNAGLVEQMLVAGKPDSLAPVLGWQAHIVYPGLEDFLESLKNSANVGLRRFPGQGETLYERLVSHPMVEKIFQDAMSSLSAQANRSFIDSVDLSFVGHLVDVGGGDGTNAMMIARRYPCMRLTVFDSASVCRIAQERITRANLSDRIATYVGDLFNTPFPADADGLLFSHMFTIHSPEKNAEVLEKSYKALRPGGSVVIFNMMADDDGTGPVSVALGSPYFLGIATGQGMLYPWRAYEHWLGCAGFSQVKRIGGLPLDHGVFVAIK